MWVPPTALARLSLLLALVPLAASAQDAPRDETTRWVPSVGARSALIGQNAEAKFESSNVSYVRSVRRRVPNTRPPPAFIEPPPRMDSINQPIRPPGAGDDLMLTPFVAGSVELMTPGLQMLPGKPRLFVRGDAGAAFGTERHLARERSPGSLPLGAVPGGNPLALDPGFIEDAVSGIGSETTAETQPLTIAAGAGIAFSFDAFGRRFRIKPSAEYLREEVDFTGSVISAQLFDTGIQAFPPNITQKPALFIPITLKGSESEVFQGVGAGLELEMDTARAGPFMITLFAGAQGVHLIGDTEVKFSDEQVLTNPPFTSPLRPNNQPISASWSFEKEPWMYSGGIGVRFRFVPE
jgi:hypothetical protein